MNSACSMLAAAEPLAGTAPHARWWWLLEVPGSWGRKAVAESRVPGLAPLASPVPGPQGPRRVLLVRRPGRHPASTNGPLRMWIAGTHPDDPPPRLARIDDANELLDWDPFDPPPHRLQVDPDAPILAVCTNAKRDACCGIEGRRLLGDLTGSSGVWECSHLGGHRFAPTALHLPSGMVYGRLNAVDAHEILAGRTLWNLARGSSALTPPLQAAQIFLADGTIAPNDWELDKATEDEVQLSVRRGASTTQMHLLRAAVGPRPASCGGEAEAAWCWTDQSPAAAAN